MSYPIFPNLPSMAWNSKKIQRWNTIVKKAGSGKRKTMTNWAYPEWEIQCSYTCLNDDEIEQVAGFLATVRGQLLPFLWLDPEDYHETKVRIGTGNGTQTEFQLLRNFANMYVEPVRDIVPGTLTVYVDDVVTPVDLGTDGRITFAAAPKSGAIITATFKYYWRVAFKDDDLDWDNFWYGYYKLNTFSVVTVL